MPRKLDIYLEILNEPSAVIPREQAARSYTVHLSCGQYIEFLDSPTPHMGQLKFDFK